jgi:phenylalanyl-tRNA synthetase beta chain
MKLSLNWIKDYVELPSDIKLSRLAHDLTMSTVEVESVTELKNKYANMVVGIVSEILPHPNAGNLKICRTAVNEKEIYDIVCGGTNLRENMKVAVALPGAMVKWHGTGDLTAIEKKKVRGVESCGMIAAASEIGMSELFSSSEEAAIIDLSEFDATAGTPLIKALGIDDVILEVDNKSLTNRPDLWGHYGIAREISAIYDLPLKKFEPYAPPSTSDFTVAIDDTQRCPRYIGVKIEGLSVIPSPFEIQSRIWRVGMRPINAIVDITNYVMLAIGQPTHAFDSDHIKGHIIVRRANNTEKLLLLNGTELSLSTEDLVIADEEGSVGLAGVMGGERDSVLPDTSTVILEIANFEPINVRHTAMRYDSRTESSNRYEKGIDPARCDLTLSLAMQMFADTYPDMTVTGLCDVYPKHHHGNEIFVSLNWLEERLGKRIPNEDISKMLERLGFEIVFDGDNMRVAVPTWRSTGDISIPDDILEEIARMYGYENFESTPITTTFESAINQLGIGVDRKIREYLAFRCGMNEIFTYPWVSDDHVNAIFNNSEGMLSLSTPPSPEERYLRTSLVPNLCKAVASNLRFYEEFSFFESAQVFFDHDFAASYDSRESLPLQRRNIAGAFVGKPKDLETLFRKAKGVIEILPRYIHLEPILLEQVKKPKWADDVVWLNIIHNDEQIGNLALLSKKAALDCEIKNNAVMIFELDIDALTPLPSRTNEFAHLSDYPMTEYDMSMLFDYSVKWEQIVTAITDRGKAGDLLRDVSFVEEYRGPKVPDGKKSITFRMVIGSKSKTLTSGEIDECVSAISAYLRRALGAECRS